jgi:hypothetical protein
MLREPDDVLREPGAGAVAAEPCVAHRAALVPVPAAALTGHVVVARHVADRAYCEINGGCFK